MVRKFTAKNYPAMLTPSIYVRTPVLWASCTRERTQRR